MADEKPLDVLPFHYLKCGTFRSIHVDGAVGSIQPTGKGIHLAFYVERLPIPQRIDHVLTASGQLGEEIEGSRIAKIGVVREMEVDAFMDMPTARSLHELLGELLAQREKAAP